MGYMKTTTQLAQGAKMDITDCWIVTGGIDNGNILWINTPQDGDTVVGGYPSVEEATKVARETLNCEPYIEES